MLHPSTKRLIDKLREKTGEQAIAWAEGENDTLVFDTEGYRVTLTDSPVEVILLDPLGKELERATNDDLAGAQAADGQTYADVLASMRGEAQRIARGAEYAIERVLAGLEKSDKETAIPPIATAEKTAHGDAEDAPTETDETSLLAGTATDKPTEVETAVHKLADEVKSSAPAMPESPAPPLRQREEPMAVRPSSGVEIPLTSIGAVAGFSGTVQVEDTSVEQASTVQPDVSPVIEDHVRDEVQAVSTEDGHSSEDALASKLLSQVASEASSPPVSSEAVDEANNVLADPFASSSASGAAPAAAVEQPEPATETSAEPTPDDQGKVKTTTRFNPWN